MEEERRKRGGRRLAACCDQQWRVHQDLQVRKPRLTVPVLLEHVRHKVAAATGHLALLFPKHCLLGSKTAVFLFLGNILGRATECTDKGTQEWVSQEHAVACSATNTLRHAEHPGVVVAAIKRVERVGKHEVANHVKRHKVEPSHKVKRLARGGPLANPCAHHIDVLHHRGLLLVHARITKRVVELPAEASVVLMCAANERVLVAWVVEAALLGPLGPTGLVLENLGETDGAIDGEGGG